MNKKIIVNGSNAILGRLSAYVAKELLKGSTVDVINCGEIIVSGNKKLFVEKIKQKRKMGKGGSMKGPKYIRQEDRLVKRIIRGMLPRDRAKGREAFKRLKCYKGKGDTKKESQKEIKNFDHNQPKRYSTIKEIVTALK